MDAELTLEPLPEKLPDAVGFSTERASTPVLDSIGVIPPHVAERVTIAPPASWVVDRPLELDPTAPTVSNHYLLVDHQHHVGRQESYSRIVRKLDTINGVQEAGRFRIHFDPRSERLTIHSLAVIRGGQRAENARMERLRLLQREMGLESLTLGGLLTVVALLEDVRTGDTLDLSFTVQSRPQIFPDHFWRWYSIPEELPVRAYCVSARFPIGRAMQWKSNDPKLAPAICEDAGETEWTWKTNIVPNTEAEANVPAWQPANRWIQMTDFTSWSEVAAGLAAAWKEDLENPEITRLAESIAAKAATPAHRAEDALTYLQDEIRNLPVIGDPGGSLPAEPALTFKRGFGDARDKSFAAAHLLRRLGIPARPMLVHASFCQGVKEFLPMPAAFNHAVVEYEIDDRHRWVDVTATHQGGTVLSRPGAPFQLGLPVGPEVKDLEPITLEASSDRVELKETFLIDTSGRTSSLRVILTATGREADRWRRSMAGEGVEVFAQRREQFYQRIFPHAQRAGRLEWEDDRENNEFVIGEVFDLHEFASSKQERQGIRFRLTAHTIQAVLGFHQRGKRRSPWVLPFPCRIRHIIELDSPSLRKPVGKNARVDASAFRFSSNWHGHQGNTTITFTLQTLKDSVLPIDFEAFKKDVFEVWSHTAIVGNLPPGSSVPWKKRTSENVLPPRRNPILARQPLPASTEAISLPPTAPACGSESNAPRKEGMTGSSVIPRQERSVPTHKPVEARERPEIRRPNPVLPSPEELMAASSTRRHSRRRARRARRRLVIGMGIIVGALAILILVLFFLHHR